MSRSAPGREPPPRPRRARLHAALLGALSWGALIPLAGAQPADTWTNVRPGVDYLRRVAAGPQAIFAVRVDLRVPNVSLHASADRTGERGVTTPTFARNVGALVAINGDWSDGRTPVGLAISDGFQWHDHIPNDRVGGHWGYFGCTSTKRCELGVARPLDVDWELLRPTGQPHRFFQALGANGVPLVQDGVAARGCFDTVRNPRSALGLSRDGGTLWLVVVDGRRSGAVGMTCDETRALLLGLGCHQGVMLDGGGSSTLVVDGAVRNTPSDGSPRVVANHLAVMYAARVDPACVVASGRWCSGTRLYTCQGGRALGSGDCAAYGASCERDGDHAYCVDYRCPGGRGNGSRCVDATHLASCNDGQYATGDCGAFGLACVTDPSGAARCATSTPPDAGVPPRDTGVPMDTGVPPRDTGAPMDTIVPLRDTGADRGSGVDTARPADTSPPPEVGMDSGIATAGEVGAGDAPSEDGAESDALDGALDEPSATPRAEPSGCGCRVPATPRTYLGNCVSLLALAALCRRPRSRRRARALSSAEGPERATRGDPK